ncbi:MAG: restriction endonuclease [Ignavibacteria bacterium]|nr:restriction endonuclease [Ignavibacteria bacterium]
MPIPDFQSIMLPLLKFASDRKEHSNRESIDYLANYFELNEEDRKKILPSGQQYVFDNRVGWARTFLKKAGLLESTRRSYIQITEKGIEELNKNPEKINVKYLEQFPEFIEFRNLPRERGEDEQKIELEQTPEELLEYGYQRIKRGLAQELLNLVKKSSPRFFEKLVVDLLIKMGYGGSLKEAGEAVGQTGDGGIDGIIKEDKLGLDIIYIQAKRWDNVVGSKDVRNFVGSLVGQHSNKGVFITTSSFTKDALDYVKKISHKVILIDGEMLAQLMIENDIGVTKVSSYDIKKIDTDYFEEE